MNADDRTHTTDILIVGAGVAGLTAAAALREGGYASLVVDKGRGLGGRLANRRIGNAVMDHGAQFMTARDGAFRRWVDRWLSDGVVAPWFESDSGHVRWRGVPRMNAIAKSLAEGIDTRLGTQVLDISGAEKGWNVETDNGAIRANAILMTPPVPQSLKLLRNVNIPAHVAQKLEALTYEKCLAAVAVLDGPSRVPPPGGLAPETGPIAWIADNQMKGISDIPALTIHGSASFSEHNWERDREAVGRDILAAAAEWIAGSVLETAVHGWRYSKPIELYDEPAAVAHVDPPLILAGDAFVAPRVEGAALSGQAAADRLMTLLPKRSSDRF